MTTILHNCDTIVNWSPTYATVENDTVDKREGIACVLLTGDPTASVEAAIIYPVQGDGSIEPLLEFDIKPSRTAPDINPQLQVFAPNASNKLYFDLSFAPQLNAGVWNPIILDLRSPDSISGTPNIATIRGIEFYFRNNMVADIYKIDYIRLEPTGEQWALTIFAGVGGTVNPSGTINGISGVPTPLITAIPTMGHSFSHWLLDGVQYSENPISLTISDVLTHILEAVFVPTTKHTLAINSNPISGIPFTIMGGT